VKRTCLRYCLLVPAFTAYFFFPALLLSLSFSPIISYQIENQNQNTTTTATSILPLFPFWLFMCISSLNTLQWHRLLLIKHLAPSHTTLLTLSPFSLPSFKTHIFIQLSKFSSWDFSLQSMDNQRSPLITWAYFFQGKVAAFSYPSTNSIQYTHLELQSPYLNVLVLRKV